MRWDVRMRWEQLFADLEARFAAVEQAGFAIEVADRIRSEAARTGLAERMAGAVGAGVRVVTLGGATTTGTVRRGGPDWVLVDEPGGTEVLVPLASVAVVTGLTRSIGRPGGGGVVGARLGVASVLRGIARDRLPVVLDLVDGTRVGGTVDRVGRDLIELADTGPDGDRRAGGARSSVVAIAAVAQVRRT